MYRPNTVLKPYPGHTPGTNAEPSCLDISILKENTGWFGA